MKLTRCQVSNFGSFKKLEFDFSQPGLSLLYGATGSGKSTFQDIATWILLGVISKDISVDQIKSWTGNGEPTEGCLTIETPQGNFTITRIRGKANENDLYYHEDGSPFPETRGKDLSDTQKRIEARLGFSADIYCTAACFNEFSDAALFFLANSKDRRSMCERIVNLDLPKKLAEKCLIKKKELKAELEHNQTAHSALVSKAECLESEKADAQKRAKVWDKEHKKRVKVFELEANNFQVNLQKTIKDITIQIAEFEQLKSLELEKLHDELKHLKNELSHNESLLCEEDGKPCELCGQPRNSAKVSENKVKKQQYEKNVRQVDFISRLLEKKNNEENPYSAALVKAKGSENHYKARLESEIAAINPFYEVESAIERKILETQKSIVEKSEFITATEATLENLERLYELSSELRGRLLRQTIDMLEQKVNHYLETYFDAEIKASFSLENGDKLNVSLQKNGHECSYVQLSKGQRGLLKLCFAISIMKAAANNCGVHFNTLFFDEALDGLDASLKVKAFDLFQYLQTEHESIFLVDHAPEFQNLFEKKYLVTLVGDSSQIQEQ